MADLYIIPVKNVLKMINSCQTSKQIQNCKILVDNYIKTAKIKGLINLNDLKSRLLEELMQREESIYLSDMFNS